MTVEPGHQLAGRYVVEDLLGERAGARLWRAVDQVLRRSVAIDVISADAPRAEALVRAARRSAVATDGRFLRVLDTSEENGDVYVVREFARGESLDLVLADGPLAHRRAAWVVREISEAIGTAHEAGIYHLRLVPQNIIVTDTGAVKILGLATEAALHGIQYADAEAEDVRGLGRLLYACLVTHWPGGPESGLPTAPTEHGRLMRPQQVRAGVPRSLDETCDRILGEPPKHQAPPLRHASEVALSLADTVRPAGDLTGAESTAVHAGRHASPAEHTSRLPMRDQLRKVTPVRREPRPARTEPTAHHPAVAAASPAPNRTSVRATAPATVPPGQDTEAPRRRGIPPWGWLLVGIAIASAAILAFYLGLSAGDGGETASPEEPDRSAAAPAKPIEIASATAWDPQGEDGENDEDAPLTIDEDPASAWSTLSYERSPNFGNLKDGLGLILDLGEPVAVSEVRLALGGSGTDFEIRAAPEDAAQPPPDPAGFLEVGGTTGAAGSTRVELDQGTTTRYVLVWITKLPPEEGGGTFRASISDIDVRG
ncbi:MAG: hypothetical protein GEU93_07755 [Propionibacteriales bacterium]|nr:hypothetical protein [Propionibacteriales bacterium]